MSSRRLISLYLAFSAGQFCIWAIGYHLPGIFTHPFETALFETVMWMIVAALGLAAGYMLPIESGPSKRQVLTLVSGAVAIVVLHDVLVQVLAPRLEWQTRGFLNNLIAGLQGGLLTATSYVALGSGLAGAVSYQRTQARLAALDTQLAQSRLAALQTHFRPDFVLGAMESIADHILDDPRDANERIAELGELLALQLQRSRQPRVTVEQELEFMRRYVAVDQSCSGAVIEMRISLDEGAGTFAIPPNSISLLLESALRARPASPGRTAVQVEVRIQDAALHVSVRDDCPVPAALRRVSDSDDLAGLPQSLLAEFGARAVLTFHDSPPGVTSRIHIPLETP